VNLIFIRFVTILFLRQNTDNLDESTLDVMRTFVDVPDKDVTTQVEYGLRHLRIDGEDLFGHTGPFTDTLRSLYITTTPNSQSPYSVTSQRSIRQVSTALSSRLLLRSITNLIFWYSYYSTSGRIFKTVG
jgi:hypothetical protein